MKKLLFLTVLAVSALFLCSAVTAQSAQATQTIDKKFKAEAYTEFISFTGKDIDGDAWGGGILARYLFLDWLGAQTNVSFYNESYEKKLGGDLSFINWRLTALLHTYVPAIADPLYVYGGAGVGAQINDDVGSIGVDNAFTGHVLGGLGYDITDIFNVEAEIGYQFGEADLSNFTDSKANVDAVFVRLGGGIRF